MGQSDRKEQAALRTLVENDRFCGYYLLKSASSGVTARGAPYLSFRLADRTGELPGKLWDYSGPVGPGDAGRAVWASGRVETYQDAPQASLEELRLLDEGDAVDPALLVPSAPADKDVMLKYVEKTLGGLEDADYRNVCLAILDRHREGFAAYPAAISMHHDFRHGLLMHTAKMMQTAERLADVYFGVVDRSLLLAGVFLHDIGKLAEFETTELGLVGDYSPEGQLLGHLFLGAEEVGAAARELGVPEEKRLLLQHLIASHHGKAEFNAIVAPKCAEAELLSELDMIDSRMEMYRRAYEETGRGCFTRQKVYGLVGKVYRPAAKPEQKDE